MFQYAESSNITYGVNVNLCINNTVLSETRLPCDKYRITLVYTQSPRLVLLSEDEENNPLTIRINWSPVQKCQSDFCRYSDLMTYHYCYCENIYNTAEKTRQSTCALFLNGGGAIDLVSFIFFLLLFYFYFLFIYLSTHLFGFSYYFFFFWRGGGVRGSGQLCKISEIFIYVTEKNFPVQILTEEQLGK